MLPAAGERGRYTALGLSQDPRKLCHGSSKALLMVGSRQSHFQLVNHWLTAKCAEVQRNETALLALLSQANDSFSGSVRSSISLTSFRRYSVLQK